MLGGLCFGGGYQHSSSFDFRYCVTIKPRTFPGDRIPETAPDIVAWNVIYLRVHFHRALQCRAFFESRRRPEKRRCPGSTSNSTNRYDQSNIEQRSQSQTK